MSTCKESCKGLEDKIEDLEEEIKRLNATIDSLYKILNKR